MRCPSEPHTPHNAQLLKRNQSRLGGNGFVRASSGAGFPPCTSELAGCSRHRPAGTATRRLGGRAPLTRRFTSTSSVWPWRAPSPLCSAASHSVDGGWPATSPGLQERPLAQHSYPVPPPQGGECSSHRSPGLSIPPRCKVKGPAQGPVAQVQSRLGHTHLLALSPRPPAVQLGARAAWLGSAFLEAAGG